MILTDVSLRKLEDRDLDRLYEFRNDWQIVQFLGGFSTGYSRRDLAEWLEFHRKRRDEIIWAIADRESDQCIGHIALYEIDHRVRKAELGIVIGFQSYQGRGIGEEACRAVLRYGFRELNLHRVELTVLAHNESAIRLYKRLGFSVEGRLRHDQYRDGQYLDSIAMGLLRDEWLETS